MSTVVNNSLLRSNNTSPSSDHSNPHTLMRPVSCALTTSILRTPKLGDHRYKCCPLQANSLIPSSQDSSDTVAGDFEDMSAMEGRSSSQQQLPALVEIVSCPVSFDLPAIRELDKYGRSQSPIELVGR
jgi:hypothetical protein